MAENSRPNLYLVSNDNPTGGGRPPGDGELEARVKTLEDKFDRIDGKLDTILADVSIMKETLATKDSVAVISERVAKLETAVSMLPGTMQLILFVIAVLGIAGLAKYFAP